VDNGGDHGGTTDRSRPATQGGHVVDNSPSSSRHRLADARLLRPGRVSSVDGRLGAESADPWHVDVCQTQPFVVQVVADRRGRRHDVNPAALSACRLYGRHHRLPRAISTFQKQRKSTADSWSVHSKV